MQVFESGAVQDMCGEDVSFCLDAIELVSIFGVTLVFELVTRRHELFEVTVKLKWVRVVSNSSIPPLR